MIWGDSLERKECILCIKNRKFKLWIYIEIFLWKMFVYNCLKNIVFDKYKFFVYYVVFMFVLFFVRIFIMFIMFFCDYIEGNLR